jgi:hypothetical protein
VYYVRTQLLRGTMAFFSPRPSHWGAKLVGSCISLTDKRACPICNAENRPRGWGQVECSRCRTLLRPARSGLLKCIRVVVFYDGSALIAWKRGWEPSFIIFVVGFYMIPVVFAWIYIEPPSTKSLKRTEERSTSAGNSITLFRFRQLWPGPWRSIECSIQCQVDLRKSSCSMAARNTPTWKLWNSQDGPLEHLSRGYTNHASDFAGYLKV